MHTSSSVAPLRWMMTVGVEHMGTGLSGVIGRQTPYSLFPIVPPITILENHRDVATAIARSAIPRSELWITSKVRTIDTSLNHAATVAEVDKILAELKLEQLDLLLLHHAKGNGAKERAAQWQALLEVAKAGKARHVGVSNYDLAQLKGLQACW